MPSAPVGDGPDRVGVRDHREDDLARLCDLARGAGPARALHEQGLGLLACAVPDRHVVTGGEQPPDDRAAHHPEPDVAELSHAGLPSGRRPPTRARWSRISSRARTASPAATAARICRCSSDRALGALGDLVDGAERAPKHVADRLHAVEHEPVAGGTGEREVEAQVGVDERVGAARPFERGRHLVDRGVHLGEVLLPVALGCQCGRLALEDPAQLEQVVHARLLVEAEEEPQRGLERIRRLGHDERTAVRGRDHALRLEHAQRLADRRAANLEALRQLALGRQRVARLQPPGADLGKELIRDLEIDLASLEGLKARGISFGLTSRRTGGNHTLPAHARQACANRSSRAELHAFRVHCLHRVPRSG